MTAPDAAARRAQLIPREGWNHASQVRIAPSEPDERRWIARGVVWLMQRIAKIEARNLFLTLTRHWGLLIPWTSFAARLVPFGALARTDSELVVLRVAWNCRCRYEWGQHVDIALRAGMSVDEIARVPLGPEARGWSVRQSTLLRAADEFHSDGRVSEATWNLLLEHFATKLLIEICMLIGHYEMLAGVLNTLGLPLDAALEQQLATATVDWARQAEAWRA